MVQLNLQQKPLFNDRDIKNAAPFLFGEIFGSLTKEHLDVADGLLNRLLTLVSSEESPSKRSGSWRGATSTAAILEGAGV